MSVPISNLHVSPFAKNIFCTAVLYSHVANEHAGSNFAQSVLVFIQLYKEECFNDYSAVYFYQITCSHHYLDVSLYGQKISSQLHLSKKLHIEFSFGRPVIHRIRNNHWNISLQKVLSHGSLVHLSDPLDVINCLT